MPNGGFNAYSQRVTKKKTAHPYPEPRSITVTVQGGQVLKEATWLTWTDTGSVIAHTGLSRSLHFEVTGVNPAAAGDSFILTLGSSVYTLTVKTGKTMTAEEVVQAFATGVTSKGDIVATGTPTPTPYPEFLASASAPTQVSANKFEPAVLRITSRDFDAATMAVSPITFTTASANVSIAPAVTATGVPNYGTSTGTGHDPIAGLLMYDVAAVDKAGSPVDTQAQALVSGSYWADYIRWETDSFENIADADGIVHQCTAYHTGCASDKAYQVFVSGTEFNIVTQLAGEVEI